MLSDFNNKTGFEDQGFNYLKRGNCKIAHGLHRPWQVLSISWSKHMTKQIKALCYGHRCARNSLAFVSKQIEKPRQIWDNHKLGKNCKEFQNRWEVVNETRSYICSETKATRHQWTGHCYFHG